MDPFNRDGRAADGAWSAGRRAGAAEGKPDTRWAEFAAAERSSPLSFGDVPHQLRFPIEHEATVYSDGTGIYVDPYRRPDPANTTDGTHATHCIPRPRSGKRSHETTFGRRLHGWNEYPFSPRERILNTLQKDDALSPDQIAALALGLEGYRAAGGGLSSSQHRAMVDMISDPGHRYRRTR